QRELRGQLALYGHGNELRALPAEEEVEVAPQPLFRFAVVTEVPLLLVEAAVVCGAEHVVQVLVVDDRLDEERRYVRRVQERVDADLARHMVVRAEADGAPVLAPDLLSP